MRIFHILQLKHDLVVLSATFLVELAISRLGLQTLGIHCLDPFLNLRTKSFDIFVDALFDEG